MLSANDSNYCCKRYHPLYPNLAHSLQHCCPCQIAKEDHVSESETTYAFFLASPLKNEHRTVASRSCFDDWRSRVLDGNWNRHEQSVGTELDVLEPYS